MLISCNAIINSKNIKAIIALILWITKLMFLGIVILPSIWLNSVLIHFCVAAHSSKSGITVIQWSLNRVHTKE